MLLLGQQNRESVCSHQGEMVTWQLSLQFTTLTQGSHIKPGYIAGGGAPFIPLKAAQWHEAKKLDIRAIK